MPPGLTRVRGFEKPQRGSGVDYVLSRGIFRNDVGAAMGARDALQLDPGAAAVTATVNTAAGAGENQLGVRGIHADGKDVGVIDEALVNRFPCGAAIDGFPGKMGCSCVNDL